MGDLTDQANRAALDQVKASTPQSFTVGGSLNGKRLEGGITYDRKWSNGWGATAYIRAWYEDLPVSTHTKKIQGAAGGEITKKF